LNLTVNADTNLTILEAFVPDSSINGRMKTQAGIRGTGSSPSVNGYVQIAGASLRFRNLLFN
jgi:autotransporter translocation and assembly factor TamB